MSNFPIFSGQNNSTSSRPIEVEPPVRILMTTAPSETGRSQRYCDEDEAMLQKLVRDNSGVLELTILRDPSWLRLMRAIGDASDNDRPFHVWHYVGENQSNQTLRFGPDWVALDAVGKLISRQAILRLVTLNLGSHKIDEGSFNNWDIPFVIAPIQMVEPKNMGEFYLNFYPNVFRYGVAEAITNARTKMTTDDWKLIAAYPRTSADHFFPEPQATKPPPITALKRDQVFISYAHKDADWCDQLMAYLEGLRANHVIKTWVDRDIKTGSDWRAEIDGAMARAKVVVMFAGKAFFNSSFIRTVELPYFLEQRDAGNCTVIWVAVDVYPYEMTALSTVQAVHPTNMPLTRLDANTAEDVLVKIVRQVHEALNRGN